MSERPPIEKQTKFATTVKTLDESFAFIMSYLEQVDDIVGIQIKPFWSSADDFQTKHYEVSITGVQELPAYEPENIG